MRVCMRRRTKWTHACTHTHERTHMLYYIWFIRCGCMLKRGIEGCSSSSSSSKVEQEEAQEQKQKQKQGTQSKEDEATLWEEQEKDVFHLFHPFSPPQRDRRAPAKAWRGRGYWKKSGSTSPSSASNSLTWRYGRCGARKHNARTCM
jgi:hypothetical protein